MDSFIVVIVLHVHWSLVLLQERPNKAGIWSLAWTQQGSPMECIAAREDCTVYRMMPLFKEVMLINLHTNTTMMNTYQHEHARDGIVWNAMQPYHPNHDQQRPQWEWINDREELPNQLRCLCHHRLSSPQGNPITGNARSMLPKYQGVGHPHSLFRQIHEG